MSKCQKNVKKKMSKKMSKKKCQTISNDSKSKKKDSKSTWWSMLLPDTPINIGRISNTPSFNMRVTFACDKLTLYKKEADKTRTS